MLLNSKAFFWPSQQPRPLLFVACFTVFTLLNLFRRWAQGSSQQTKLNVVEWPSSPRELAANTTLGFEKILALSPGPSWRTRGLDAAAKYVGLHITSPPQPRNPDSLIEAFQRIGAGDGKTTPARGSATAWLAHIDLLKHFIASDIESALIVEDDVDFDVHLKDQIRLASDNIRNYTRVPETDLSAYGSDWDMLWLGHCGTSMSENQAGLRYRDDTRCKTELYSGWSKHFLREYLEDDHRIVQWAGGMTVCTFAYGVHRRSAQKLLDVTARGADEAFDVGLSHACGSGKLRCLAVNPQMLNHYEPPKDTGYLSPVHVGDGQGDTTDDSKFEKSEGTTGNIMESTRCKVLFNEKCMRPPSEI